MAIENRNLEVGSHLVATYKKQAHICTVEPGEGDEGVTFVLDGPAGVEVVRDVEVETIRQAFVATKAGGDS